MGAHKSRRVHAQMQTHTIKHPDVVLGVIVGRWWLRGARRMELRWRGNVLIVQPLSYRMLLLFLVRHPPPPSSTFLHLPPPSSTLAGLVTHSPSATELWP
ncbi:unnamed protein product [Gadus morhua 'NCC']